MPGTLHKEQNVGQVHTEKDLQSECALRCASAVGAPDRHAHLCPFLSALSLEAWSPWAGFSIGGA